jgi:DNA-binding NarL/FixJ family response regulator
VLQAEADACLGHGALWDADTKLAARAIDRATARLRAIDDDALAARIACAHHLAGAEMAAERFADAAATTTRGLAIARRTQQGQPLVALLIYRAGALANLLDLDQARRDIDAAEECARLQRIPQLLALALWQRALVHHAQRAGPHASRDAAEFAELAASLEPSRLVTTGLCSTATISADEDPERCLHTILRLAGPELQQALPGWGAALLLTMVRCALALDRLEDARRWTALAHQYATRMRLPASHVRSANARAELLLATDQPRQAATLALDAAATGERTRTLYDATEARLLAGRGLAAAGDSQQAKAALQHVAADAGRGGALRLHDTAARELRRLGTRVSAESRRSARGARPQQLSPREGHIAALVADGHSNKHIAATLFLSEKTVRNALTRVYAKLGVRSRTQLTRTLTPR